MSTTAIIALVVAVVVVLAAIAFFTLARRSDVRGAGALSGETIQRDRAARQGSTPVVQTTTAADVEAAGAAARTGTALATREEAPIVPWTPPDPESIGESRRQFFNRATIGLMSVGIVTFAAAAFVAFLWPSNKGGFGGLVSIGKLPTIEAGISQGGGFFYVPEARSWITAYPAEALPAAEKVYTENILVSMRAGIVVLSQKCPHLGCRVPSCATSKWFECQCHGSQYNQAGEKKAGPAPRGMDRYPATVAANGDVTINTGKKVTGPPIGVNTTGQEAEGPHCVGGGEHK
jgi:cytochrome b6-f complex iron-sulfur subunit